MELIEKAKGKVDDHLTRPDNNKTLQQITKLILKGEKMRGRHDS